MHGSDLILVLDFGSQYSQLIARRIRELGVYSELQPYNLALEKIKQVAPKGIILSGGPSSVYEPHAPKPARGLFDLGIPILGICYGLQVIASELGGEVDRSARREFGHAVITIDNDRDLFADVVATSGQHTASVWMSHGDALVTMPPGFDCVAHSENSPICAIRDPARNIFGVQFHPEVVHTPYGRELLSSFVFHICAAEAGWNAGYFIREKTEEIRERVGRANVICALSGGVDSSVLAVLLHRAIGDQLTCIHINNGLMRRNESEDLVRLYNDSYHFNLEYIDATDEFLARLRGVVDPEQKRKLIGKTFIDVFERAAARIGDVEFLAQGTLYPDVIESVSFRGPSHTIKTHHNVGGLPAAMNLKLIEPFRELFKDEVRAVGRALGVNEELIARHPFPGPGLAVRILGDVTPEKVVLARAADAIFIDEIKAAGLYDRIWQAFAVLLPVQSVGVMGDQRTYEYVIALRAVTSVDGMTADWADISHAVLSRVSGRIVNEVRGINRVVYDISSKPPSTIEWE